MVINYDWEKTFFISIITLDTSLYFTKDSRQLRHIFTFSCIRQRCMIFANVFEVTGDLNRRMFNCHLSLILLKYERGDNAASIFPVDTHIRTQSYLCTEFSKYKSLHNKASQKHRIKCVCHGVVALAAVNKCNTSGPAPPAVCTHERRT